MPVQRQPPERGPLQRAQSGLNVWCEMRKDWKKWCRWSRLGFVQNHSSKGRNPMINLDPFLTLLYVMIDEVCQSHPETDTTRPGPVASLSRSEVITLAVFGQWGTFPRERAFSRFAEHRLRSAFPPCPLVRNSPGRCACTAMPSSPLAWR